jgi:hypothetical protein
MSARAGLPDYDGECHVRYRAAVTEGIEARREIAEAFD